MSRHTKPHMSNTAGNWVIYTLIIVAFAAVMTAWAVSIPTGWKIAITIGSPLLAVVFSGVFVSLVDVAERYPTWQR